ncbi:MAG: hypothetical protein GF334_00765 [Candidatus Altiarchaeales archaeon]|nr:hypothetical protein [Candidatus Altiarchaeales archaeon]
MTLPKAEHILSEGDEEYLEDLARRLNRAGYGFRQTSVELKESEEVYYENRYEDRPLETSFSWRLRLREEFSDVLAELRSESSDVINTKSFLDCLPRGEALCLQMYLSNNSSLRISEFFKVSEISVRYRIERALERARRLW